MNSKAVEAIKKGEMAVMPTDTVYGLVANALDEQAVEKLRKVRAKADDKPLIILISRFEDLARFDIRLTPEQEEKLKRLWPGPVSVILPCPGNKFAYLHRGGETLAIRLPADENLRNFIARTGPLVAPSANLPFQPPAKNVEEAKRYFGDQVRIYVPGKTGNDLPSTLIALSESGRIKVLRQGIAVIPESQ